MTRAELEVKLSEMIALRADLLASLGRGNFETIARQTNDIEALVRAIKVAIEDVPVEAPWDDPSFSISRA